MKIMLHTDRAGKLMVYVAKKDLEQEVIKQTDTEGAQILTLDNGWDLRVEGLTDPIETPQTIRARRVN